MNFRPRGPQRRRLLGPAAPRSPALPHGALQPVRAPALRPDPHRRGARTPLRGSHFTYAAEAAFTGETYPHYLRETLPHVRERGRIMEIGLRQRFLPRARARRGIRRGVGGRAERASRRAGEPAMPRSHPHRALRPDDVRPRAVRPDLRLPDPRPRPGPGARCCGPVTSISDPAAWCSSSTTTPARSRRVCSASSSPIVDVEHTVLFDQQTMRRIFERLRLSRGAGLQRAQHVPVAVLGQDGAAPRTAEGRGADRAPRLGLGRIPITLKAGNLGTDRREGLSMTASALHRECRAASRASPRARARCAPRPCAWPTTARRPHVGSALSRGRRPGRALLPRDARSTRRRGPWTTTSSS